MEQQERVIHSTVITDQAMIAEICQVYKESFAGTDDFCAQDQICYNGESMQIALQDPDYQKFILLAGEKIIGLCLLTNNLVKARIAYCNDRFLKKRFPNYTTQGRFHYVTAICVLPEFQNKGKGIELLKAVCQFIFDTQSMVGYDYSNNKNPTLTSLIQYVGKRMGWNAIEITLDEQHYTSLYWKHDGKPN